MNQFDTVVAGENDLSTIWPPASPSASPVNTPIPTPQTPINNIPNLFTEKVFEEKVMNTQRLEEVLPQKSVYDNLTQADFDRARKLVDRKYIFTKEVIAILELGIKLRMPVMLYGKGGHAKSAIVEDYLTELTGRTPYIKSCGSGTTNDDLFGPISSREYKENDIFVHNTAGTFLESEDAVFEELLDAPIHVLLDMKDVMTSKKFRNGNQIVPMKTKFMVCLTNRTKQEVIEDNSIAAFLERWPLSYRMEWKSYTVQNFETLFTKVIGDNMPDLAMIIGSLHDSNIWISPRTAIHCANIVKHSGYEGLMFIDGIDRDKLKEVSKLIAKRKAEAGIRNAIVDAQNILKGKENILASLKTIADESTFTATANQYTLKINEAIAIIANSALDEATMQELNVETISKDIKGVQESIASILVERKMAEITKNISSSSPISSIIGKLTEDDDDDADTTADAPEMPF